LSKEQRELAEKFAKDDRSTPASAFGGKGFTAVTAAQAHSQQQQQSARQAQQRDEEEEEEGGAGAGSIFGNLFGGRR